MTAWLITGISRGIGRALAQAALARGDTVVGTVRAEDPGIAAVGGRLHVLRFDAADPLAAEALVAAAFERVGTLDALVNNAGYGLLGPVEDAGDEEVSRLFEVNLFGPFRLIRAALPRLRAQGSGHIVNVTSIAGRDPMAGSGLYAAAKAALEALSHALAAELSPFGLRVTAVAPGSFRTDFLSSHSVRRTAAGTDVYAASVGASLAHLDGIAGRQPGDPERAAAAILRAVDAERPPVHLLLGSDALRRARARIADASGEIDRWADLARSTDRPEEA